MIHLLNIARYKALAVILLLLLAVAPAMAQLIVFQGETSTLAVEQKPGETYEWELYSDATVDFAKTSGVKTSAPYATFVGSNNGASVQVKWLLPGIYFYKVTAWNITGCANNIKIGIVEVKPSLPTAVITPPNPICDGETASLEVILTGVGPWDITFSDWTNFWTVTGVTDPTYILRVNPSVPTWYWVTEITDTNGTNTVPSDKVLLEVKPRPVSSPIYQHEP